MCFATVKGMKQKGFSLLGIILIFAAVVLLGGIWYCFVQRTSPISVSTPTIDTSSWKTYASSQFGFRFKYPPYDSVNDEGSYTSHNDLVPSDLTVVHVNARYGGVLLEIGVFSPKVVQGDYGWSEGPCGGPGFRPYDSFVSSQTVFFAGQKTLYLVSINVDGLGGATGTYGSYCVNYNRNPLVMNFAYPPSAEVQQILGTFGFSQ
jgi:hypothetical protein